jgi:hypothetical protein
MVQYQQLRHAETEHLLYLHPYNLADHARRPRLDHLHTTNLLSTKRRNNDRCLAVMIRALEFLGVFSKMATSSTPHTTAVVAHPVVTDLTICIFSPTVSPSTCELDPRIWHRIEKELYLYTSQPSARLYVALVNEEELAAEDLLVIDISVGEQP